VIGTDLYEIVGLPPPKVDVVEEEMLPFSSFVEY